MIITEVEGKYVHFQQHGAVCRPLRPKDVDVGVYSRTRLFARGGKLTALRRSVRSGALTRCAAAGTRPHCEPGGSQAVRQAEIMLSCVSALDLHDFWVAPYPVSLHARGTA